MECQSRVWVLTNLLISACFFFWGGEFDFHVETKKQRNIGGGPLDGGKSKPVSSTVLFLLQRNLEAIVLMSGFVHIPNDDGLVYFLLNTDQE